MIVLYSKLSFYPKEAYPINNDRFGLKVMILSSGYIPKCESSRLIMGK